MSPRLRTWLQLFRAPNLFTVPGDPLVGYLLVHPSFHAWNNPDAPWDVIAIVASSLCFYAFGLLLNDLADYREDLRERPERPLPSGAASPVAVGLVATLLAVLPLAVFLPLGAPRSWSTGTILFTAIFVYNTFAKRWAIPGALNMGACRALNILLGAGSVPLTQLSTETLVAGLFGLYIAAITFLARHETKSQVPIFARCLPPAAGLLLAGFLAFLTYAAGQNFLHLAGAYDMGELIRITARGRPIAVERLIGYGLLLAAVITTGRLAMGTFRRPQPLPRYIGAYIRVLLLFQAAAIWTALFPEIINAWFGPDAHQNRFVAHFVFFPELTIVFLLLAFYPLSRWAGRRFYAS